MLLKNDSRESTRHAGLRQLEISTDQAEQTAARAESLTARQKECLRYVLQGYQNKEIARQLGLSPETVKQHIAAAMKTLGASSRREAAHLLASAESGHPPLRVNPPPPVAEPPPDDTAVVPDRDWRKRLGPLGWLIPQKGETNDLTLTQRTMVLILLPLIIIFLLAGALASYEALYRGLWTVFH